MIYNFARIAEITQGSILIHNDIGNIGRIVLDSRKIQQGKEALFIAIKGERHDGHLFMKEVYNAGVRNFIVEQPVNVDQFPEASIVLVNNATNALQQLAAFHRSQFNLPVIGITGSNGKTIVKEWLNVMLADEYNIVRSPKSYNSQIGVPLSVWNIESTHTLGIFEAGISMSGEMERLAKIIQPTVGIFTSIGTAHSENFLSRRQLIGEKLNLFAKSETILCPRRTRPGPAARRLRAPSPRGSTGRTRTPTAPAGKRPCSRGCSSGSDKRSRIAGDHWLPAPGCRT
jgi:UDP-N-acetylmuramyl pentapeptide synthase